MTFNIQSHLMLSWSAWPILCPVPLEEKEGVLQAGPSGRQGREGSTWPMGRTQMKGVCGRIPLARVSGWERAISGCQGRRTSLPVHFHHWGLWLIPLIRSVFPSVVFLRSKGPALAAFTPLSCGWEMPDPGHLLLVDGAVLRGLSL